MAKKATPILDKLERFRTAKIEVNDDSKTVTFTLPDGNKIAVNVNYALQDRLDVTIVGGFGDKLVIFPRAANRVEVVPSAD